MAASRRPDRITGPYQKRGTWWLYIIVAAGEDGQGSRTSSSGPFASEEEGIEARRLLEEKHNGENRRTVQQAIDAYKIDIDSKNKAKSNTHAIWVITRFFEPVLERRLLSLKDPEEGKTLYNDLKKEDGSTYAVDTHRNMLIIARTFLRWCMTEKKWIPVNFLEGIKGKGHRRKGKDKEQLRIDEAKKWDEVALRWAREGKPGAVGGHRWPTQEGAISALITMYMDLRCFEITERIVRDLDDEGRLLWITDSKTEAGVRTQEIPEILQPFFREMARAKSPTAYLIGKGEKAHWPDYPRKWVQRICRAAGVTQVTAHAMRRFHATIAAERGQTGHQIAIAMGHGKFKVSEDSYIRRGTIRRQQLASMVDQLHGGRKEAIKGAVPGSLQKENVKQTVRQQLESQGFTLTEGLDENMLAKLVEHLRRQLAEQTRKPPQPSDAVGQGGDESPKLSIRRLDKRQ